MLFVLDLCMDAELIHLSNAGLMTMHTKYFFKPLIAFFEQVRSYKKLCDFCFDRTKSTFLSPAIFFYSCQQTSISMSLFKI